MAVTLTHHTVHSLAAVTIETSHLRVTILPDLGGKIWSLVHVPTGREFLWHNPTLPPAPVPFAAPYDDNFAGGWDECFPCDAAVTIDGVAYPDHGEIWSIPAAVDVVEHSPETATVRLTSLAPVTGARFERWITIDDAEPILRLRYVVHNPTDTALRFLWKPHPALALRGPARLDLPARRVVIDPEISTGFTATEAVWPDAPGEDGPIDLRRIPPASSESVHFYTALDVDDGWLAVTHTDERLGIALVWDPRVLPHVCVFGAFGGWRGHHTLVPEPCTAYPHRLDGAIARGSIAHLPPGRTLDTVLLAVLYTGLPHVSHVSRGGDVIR